MDSITFYPITDGNVIDSVSGVTVSGEGVSADGKASLKVGETLSLNASVTPDSVADKTVQWTSSDEQVATVDEHGVVKGVKAGTVTITATSVADSSRSGSVEVTVAAHRCCRGSCGRCCRAAGWRGAAAQEAAQP